MRAQLVVTAAIVVLLVWQMRPQGQITKQLDWERRVHEKHTREYRRIKQQRVQP